MQPRDFPPSEIRSQHPLLESLQGRYGLSIAHFQSHHLPDGRKDRLQSAGRFGRILLHLVNPYDVFLSKLFSGRLKDRDDLRMLLRALDPAKIRTLMASTCGRLLGEER